MQVMDQNDALALIKVNTNSETDNNNASCSSALGNCHSPLAYPWLSQIEVFQGGLDW